MSNDVSLCWRCNCSHESIEGHGRIGGWKKDVENSILMLEAAALKTQTSTEVFGTGLDIFQGPVCCFIHICKNTFALKGRM